MNKYPAAPAVHAQLLRKVALVNSRARALRGVIDGPVPESVLERFRILQERISAFKKADTLDNAVVAAMEVAISGRVISIEIANRPLIADSSTYRARLDLASKDLEEYCQAHTSDDEVETLLDEGLQPFGMYEVKKTEARLEKRLAELNAQREEIRRSLVAMEARLKAMGETADKSVARVEELTVHQAEAIRAALTREASDITAAFADTKQTLQERLSEFNGFREQAQSLLGQLSVEVLAGKHIKSALAEEASADKFREWALMAMGVGAVVILIVLLISIFQPFSWAGLAYRSLVSLLFVVPTAYMARESAKHRAQAIELRRASLDFAALEPFLKNVQGEEGLKIRAELARKAFFSGNAIDTTSSYGLDPQAIVIKAMEIAGDAVKKK